MVETTKESHNSALDTKILDSETVIAMGGDGTLNRVARPILLTPQHDNKPLPAVAFVALGTGNVAARAFHLPQRLSDVASLVDAKTTRRIDAGIVFQNGIAVAVFLLWLGAGLDAALIHAVAGFRSQYQGSWLMPHYFLEAPRTLMTYKFPEISVQSKQINGDFASVMIANVGLLGVGSITRFANPYDGQFNLIATPHRSRPAWCLSGILAGIHGYDFCYGVRRSHETNITLQSQESVPIQIDGEPFGPPPFDIKIMPSALPLLMPAGQCLHQMQK
jgi:diacylglycerol kinase family enzyme